MSDNDELLVGNNFLDNFPECSEKILKQLVSMAIIAENTNKVDSDSLLK